MAFTYSSTSSCSLDVTRQATTTGAPIFNSKMFGDRFVCNAGLDRRIRPGRLLSRGAALSRKAKPLRCPIAVGGFVGWDQVSS
jgi:hypothetical protein